jgi:predicted nucleic acid-binding protein
MKDNAFVDSNLVLYLYSEDEPDKSHVCKGIVSKQTSIISTQVINEVSNVLHRKMGLSASEITDVVGELLDAFVLKLIMV